MQPFSLRESALHDVEKETVMTDIPRRLEPRL